MDHPATPLMGLGLARTLNPNGERQKTNIVAHSGIFVYDYVAGCATDVLLDPRTAA